LTSGSSFALVAAAVLSFLLGILFTETVRAVPCQGERLVCNIDQAIGAYAVAIWAVLGPCIFGLTLLVARNRVALAGAAIVLFAPLIIFFAVVSIETWRYVGFDGYGDWRKFLVTLAPPVLAVLVQWFILRVVVMPEQMLGGTSKPGAIKPGRASEAPAGSIFFPTE
jgi:hypothetical protein